MTAWQTLKRIASVVPDYIRYDLLLPIDGKKFTTPEGAWLAKVVEWPIPSQESTVLVYRVEFYGPRLRKLKVLAAPEQLIDGHPEAEANRQKALDRIAKWLEGEENDGNVKTWD